MSHLTLSIIQLVNQIILSWFSYFWYFRIYQSSRMLNWLVGIHVTKRPENIASSGRDKCFNGGDRGGHGGGGGRLHHSNWFYVWKVNNDPLIQSILIRLLSLSFLKLTNFVSCCLYIYGLNLNGHGVPLNFWNLSGIIISTRKRLELDILTTEITNISSRWTKPSYFPNCCKHTNLTFFSSIYH